MLLILNESLNKLSAVRFALVICSVTGLLTACGGGGGGGSETTNQNPTVTLGADFSANEQTAVSLPATATDSDGQISSYTWQQTAGPAVTISGTDTLSFTAPVVTQTTMLGFTVTVTDNQGATASDAIEVSILPVNLPPGVQMPAPITADEQTSVTVTATASDSDGSIATLLWSQTAGTAVTLTGADTASVSFDVPVADTDLNIELTLTATDNETATTSETIQITIEHVNRAPEITSLSLPDASSGRIPVTIVHSDFESDALTLSLEFSSDAGATWQFASLDGLSSTGFAADAGGTTTVTWDSLADLGFRDPGTSMLRAIANDGALSSTALAITTHSIDNLQAAVDRVDHQAIYYSTLDSTSIAALHDYQLVVLHPGSGNLDRTQVAAVQAGANVADPGDDVLVFCYVSIGEDIRTVGVDWATTSDARFLGDGSGPRVDPRTDPYDGGVAITGIDPLGDPSTGGTGFASYYLDDVSTANSAADGLPDINTTFGGAFVNIGDPAWFTVLDNMTLATDSAAGMAEILTLTTGRGLGCDGLFLDTVDTAAPNSFTANGAANQSEFEWTAAGFADFTGLVKAAYPRALLLQNRGLFYYDPRFPHYAVNARADIDVVLFESYRLDSSTAASFSADFFADNKFNFTPKLMAEANRPDGFKVISLGYAEGPVGEISSDTLLGTSSLGLALLQDDISEAMEAGFRHYLTNGAIDLLNNFVLDNVVLADTQAPQWSSSYNDSGVFPPTAPTAHVGLQQLDAGAASLTLHWDVALDQNAVSYAAYYQTQPFDFGAADPLASATRAELTPDVGDNYTDGVGPGVYPYQASIDGLSGDDTYYVLVRAYDASPAANEDTNQVVLSASLAATFATITIDADFSDWAAIPVALSDAADVADSNGPDWLDISIANDADFLYLRTASENAFNLNGSPGGFSRLLIYLDVDDNPGTGFTIAGIGADLLINNNALYSMATGSVFSSTYIADLSVLPIVAITDMEWAVPMSNITAIAPSASQIRLVFQNDEVSDLAPDSGSLGYVIAEP